MKEKLSPDAQEHVMVADASALGLGTISVGLTQSNFCIDAPLFSLDGQHMRLTRYPNSNSTEDWMHVETVDPTQTSGTYPKVKLTDETVLGWDHNAADRIYFGYFSYGWALHGFHGTLDPETGIVTATDASHYGSAAGLKPMLLYNAYESLDEPGEWYYDQTSGRLYIYPFADTTRNSTLRMTSSNFDLISVKNASYLNLEGLTVTSSKKNGIVMDGVDHCVIDSCTLTDFEERAISIDNATNSGIQNSEIAYTSVTAMYLDGGDFQTMTPGCNFISNCRIHDTNQHRTFNEGGVKLRGVKNTFSSNEVYNITDIALNFAIAGDAETSLDCVIENNSFHDVILNGKDMAAVYGGRDARCQGLIIRNNHFYNLGNNDASYPNFAGSAVYMDDGLSGAAITGNIFGPGASGNYIEAIKINCGHDNVITNNLFIDMPCALYAYIDSNFETRMTSDSGYGTADTLKQVWNNERYTERWPWMAAAREGATDFYIQNTFENNILIYTDASPRGSEKGESNWVETNDHQNSKITGIEENLAILKGEGDNRQLFAGYASGNYALVDSVLAQLPGFEQIDQNKIGVKSFPGNQKPTASGVSVSGTAEVGQTITAAYTFSDADGDSEGATIANYYISESPDDLFYLNWKKVSDNMTCTEFTVTPICEGHERRRGDRERGDDLVFRRAGPDARQIAGIHRAGDLHVDEIAGDERQIAAARAQHRRVEYIKIDFLTHGCAEADYYYDPEVQTGMQAYNKGMAYLLEQMEGMYITMAISPLFPSQYAHSRRIACDAWAGIGDTEYTLNSLTYGWWLNQVYTYNDPDHLLLEPVSDGENRARITSGVITVIFMNGDDLSYISGIQVAKDKARKFLTNEDINAIAKMGKSFRLVNGNMDGADFLFMHDTGKEVYLAAFNYSGYDLTYDLPLSRLGLRESSTYKAKELWSGKEVKFKKNVRVCIPKKDVLVFRITR